MERIIGKVINWLVIGLEGELGLVCNLLVLWYIGKFGGIGFIIQQWFEFCNMLNSVTWASSINSFIISFFVIIAWSEVFKVKILVQSNVMIFVTSFLLYACNLDFSNTLISNLSVAIVLVLLLSNFLSLITQLYLFLYFVIFNSREATR